MKSEKRLKILFLAAWYPSEKSPVEGIFVKEHAKAVALYNDVTVIAFSGRPRTLRRLYEVSENIEDEVRTIRIKQKSLPIPKAKDLIRWCSVISFFRKMFKEGYKPDIIHAHEYSAGVPSVILGRLYNIPVIITEHWTGFPLRKLTLYNKVMARFAMNRASIILPVSENLKRHIEYYGIKNKYCVVPNVVNTRTFYPLSNEIKRNDGTKKILMVALLDPKKGVPYLLEALYKIKEIRQDFSLDIIGDGPNRSEYEKMAADLELNKIVKFHGLKPKEKVAEFIRQCDFFVLPSIIETFGVVLIKALASGKPVIATDSGGPNEIINDNIGLIVLPKNSDMLAEAIIHMLDHYKEYSSKSIAQYARNYFGYKAVGEMLTEIYAEIIKESSE